MSAAAGERPNLLVVMADQLRRQALGVYGDMDVATPNIDALAARGVRFDNACATSPICVPFRFTFMTGAPAHTRQVAAIEWRMSPAERTLADAFGEAGYQTVYVGKWHLSGGHGGAPWASRPLVNRTPIPRAYRGGWEVWRGFELRNDPFDTWYFADDDPEPVRLEGYQTDALTDLTIETLRSGRDPERPFFCVLSVEPPHPPFVVPEADRRRWETRPITLPGNFAARDAAGESQLLHERRMYYAAVENLDANVGRLMRFLDEEGLSESTVVVFLSDHGELGGSHGLREKQYPFEESVGIPLIVADPRRPERHGAVVAAPACTEDLFPTLLGLAGVGPDGRRNAGPRGPHAVGVDLAPLIAGERDDLDRDAVALEFSTELRAGQPFFHGGWRALRGRRYKYALIQDADGVRPWFLFDLQEDPGETRNLLNDPAHSATCRAMHETLVRWLEETDDTAFVTQLRGGAG
ncbi:MAG TPA: sulfatase [Trueperaceae bacterium]|nr:sulfatase [Trueperaceae bacterium]